MSKSRFKTVVRVDEKQKEWLKKNKRKNNCKTLAGFLDKIINKFRNNEKEV